MVKGQKSKAITQISRQLTFNVHKFAHRVQFKKKAPRAVRQIRKLVTKMFKTQDVRIDTKLNQMVWSKGIKNLPRKIRIRVSRKQDTNNQKGQKFYCLVEGLKVLKKSNRDQFVGKLTQKSKTS